MMECRQTAVGLPLCWKICNVSSLMRQRASFYPWSSHIPPVSGFTILPPKRRFKKLFIHAHELRAQQRLRIIYPEIAI